MSMDIDSVRARAEKAGALSEYNALMRRIGEPVAKSTVHLTISFVVPADTDLCDLEERVLHRLKKISKTITVHEAYSSS